MKRLSEDMIAGDLRHQRIFMAAIIETVTKIDKLRQKLARQFRVAMFRDLREHGDEIIEQARKDKSIKPAELRQLTQFVEILKATK